MHAPEAEEAPGHWGHVPPQTFIPIVSAPPPLPQKINKIIIISSSVLIMHACGIAEVASYKVIVSEQLSTELWQRPLKAL